MKIMRIAGATVIASRASSGWYGEFSYRDRSPPREAIINGKRFLMSSFASSGCGYFDSLASLRRWAHGVLQPCAILTQADSKEEG